MGTTIMKTAEADQEEQDKAQERLGQQVEQFHTAEAAASEIATTRQMLSTKQTTKEHLGKIAADENKPDEMEALKVGKSVSEPANLLKVEQTAVVTDVEGEQSDQVVDIIQVPVGAAQVGRAIPGGDIGSPTEPQLTAMAVEEAAPVIEPTGVEGSETPRRKKKK